MTHCFQGLVSAHDKCYLSFLCQHDSVSMPASFSIHSSSLSSVNSISSFEKVQRTVLFMLMPQRKARKQEVYDKGDHSCARIWFWYWVKSGGSFIGLTCSLAELGLSNEISWIKTHALSCALNPWSVFPMAVCCWFQNSFSQERCSTSSGSLLWWACVWLHVMLRNPLKIQLCGHLSFPFISSPPVFQFREPVMTEEE